MPNIQPILPQPLRASAPCRPIAHSLSLIILGFLLLALTPPIRAQQQKAQSTPRQLPLNLQAPPLGAEHIAILYNTNVPASKQLAEYYAQKRGVPTEHLIGLPLPKGGEITREQYQKKLREPLRQALSDQNLWQLKEVRPGFQAPAKSKVRLVLTTHGVPFKIKRTPAPKGPDGKPVNPKLGQQDEASVDSELMLIGAHQPRVKSLIPNPYYQQDFPFPQLRANDFFLTARIDGPNLKICKRLIDHALKAEAEGLLGRCYLDLARKGKGYDVGDQWIEAILQQNLTLGIPSVVERTTDTYVTNYPLNDAMFYFGWYAHHRNGPLRNAAFRFPPGAIAVHIHSFSAAQLRNPNKHWVGPLLAKGACATLGNVYEPYLDYTHHLDIFYQRLTKGYTLAEAAAMALPGISWQALVIGDPLYRPFKNFTNPVAETDGQRTHLALRLAAKNWSNQPEKHLAELEKAATRMNSPSLYEALGLRLWNTDKVQEARAHLTLAGDLYPEKPDQLRCRLHAVALDREAGKKALALARIDTLLKDYQGIPEHKSIQAYKLILDPPPPPKP